MTFFEKSLVLSSENFWSFNRYLKLDVRDSK